MAGVFRDLAVSGVCGNYIYSGLGHGQNYLGGVMIIKQNYPKYEIQLEPHDINNRGEKIGECQWTKEPMFIDFSKTEGITPSEDVVWKLIASTYDLDPHYVKYQMKPVLTWQTLRNIIDLHLSPYAEISSIEIHNYGENFSLHFEELPTGAITISDGEY